MYINKQNHLVLGTIGFTHDVFSNTADHDTTIYYPLEYYTKHETFKSFDIWSLGVVFYEIISNCRLFANSGEIAKIDRSLFTDSGGGYDAIKIERCIE